MVIFHCYVSSPEGKKRRPFLNCSATAEDLQWVRELSWANQCLGDTWHQRKHRKTKVNMPNMAKEYKVNYGKLRIWAYHFHITTIYPPTRRRETIRIASLRDGRRDPSWAISLWKPGLLISIFDQNSYRSDGFLIHWIWAWDILGYLGITRLVWCSWENCTHFSCCRD